MLFGQIRRQATGPACIHVGCEELCIHPLQLLLWLRALLAALLQGSCHILRPKADTQSCKAVCDCPHSIHLWAMLMNRSLTTIAARMINRTEA